MRTSSSINNPFDVVGAAQELGALVENRRIRCNRRLAALPELIPDDDELLILLVESREPTILSDCLSLLIVIELECEWDRLKKGNMFLTRGIVMCSEFSLAPSPAWSIMEAPEPAMPIIKIYIIFIAHPSLDNPHTL
jgi:hypothetical protein